MSIKPITIKKSYALSAIDKAGKRVYYDTDPQSGGYAYWSPWMNQDQTWESLDKIPTFSREHYMCQLVTSIEVLEVQVRVKVVQSTELVSVARAKAMAEIAKIQEDLAHRVAMLEDIK